MADPAFAIERLKKRADFLACAQAPSCARGAVVVQARPRGDATPLVRAGFTATKRIGGAVQGAPRRRALSPPLQPQNEGGGIADVLGSILTGGGGRRQSAAEALVKSAMRSVGSNVGRQVGNAIVRGVLGSIMKR